jgi:hypothetical protein
VEVTKVEPEGSRVEAKRWKREVWPRIREENVEANSVLSV